MPITEYQLIEKGIDPGLLHKAIEADPAIIVTLDHVEYGSKLLKVFMASVLPAPEETALYSRIGMHVNKQSMPDSQTFAADGRLTLVSGVPVSPLDQTAKTEVFYTPTSLGDIISLNCGSSWKDFAFPELTLTVPETMNTNFDVFAYAKGNMPVLESTDWTNDSTRAVGLTIDRGKPVKSGDATRLFLGTLRTTGVSGQTEDSATKRFVWNEYNRTRRKLKVSDSTATHTYTTATWRSWNADATMRVEVVIGQPHSLIELAVYASSRNVSGASPTRTIGTGEDRTNGTDSDMYSIMSQGVGIVQPSVAKLTKAPAAGYHFYQWVEWAEATGTTTWWNFFNLPTGQIQSGMVGSIDA